MKKILLIGLVLLLPAAVFADVEFGVGGTALYNSPLLVGQEISVPDWNVNKFSFGPDLRFKWSILQLEALGLFSYGDYSSIDTYLDAGLAFDILFLRLSAGGGLSLNYNFVDKSLDKGFNVKLNGDIKLGKLSLGLTYIMDLTVDDGVDLAASSGLLGATAMFWF
ncbi:MAG: hypothetical protein JW820_04885 [Spirochaetales bacterium]|nr:hypothetical protein [Spirochaetales bacterium]